MKTLIVFLSIALTVLVDINIYKNNYSHLLVLLWILSIIFFLTSCLGKITLPKIKLSKRFLLLLFVGLLPIAIRTVNFNLDRMHGDDIIGAYLSQTTDFTKFNFFSGFPPKADDWESQFQAPFFILQRLFFTLFPANLLTVKLSIMPYVFVLSVLLFLITEKILNTKMAVLAVFFYSYLAINLYLETVGLWIVSGTTIFLVFFYFLINNFSKNNKNYIALTGISCGACYLFYFTSYIALPIMLGVFIFRFLTERTWYLLQNSILAIIGFFIVISPFFTNALRFNNYFSQRVSQMSLIEQEGSKVSKVGENILLSTKSLYLNGIGGHGGVNFGKLALFERLTILLMISGIISAVIILPRKREMLLVLLTILLSFGMLIFSLPPPAYHRFALAFPFLNIISTLPFYLFILLKKVPAWIKYSIVYIYILLFAVTNQIYFERSVLDENYHESLRLSNYINKNFPNRNIYVASYPGFGFEKTYFFSRGKNYKKIGEGYHAAYLEKFNKEEKYVYIILFPHAFDEKFQFADPNGRIIKFSSSYSLFVN